MSEQQLKDSQAQSTASTGTAPVIRRDSDRPSAPRQRRANLGGARLKLQVHGSIPGFHLYWCNDEDSAIEQLLSEGFTFVEPKEVQMESFIVQDQDVANRVSKYVGSKKDGSPLRAFLLKCPDEIWEDIQAAGQEQADAWDSAILAGKVGDVDNRYKPKGLETRLNRHNER